MESQLIFGYPVTRKSYSQLHIPQDKCHGDFSYSFVKSVLMIKVIIVQGTPIFQTLSASKGNVAKTNGS